MKKIVAIESELKKHKKSESENCCEELNTFYIREEDEMETQKNCCGIRRPGESHYLIYPDDSFTSFWDIFIALVLIFSCTVTPYRLALVSEDTPNWVVTNVFIDIMFLLDIILIFNTAYYDEEFLIIQDRKTIALTYIRGWFPIDLVAIIPFDLLFGGNELNNLVRVARLGKMYKLVKLTRLIRVAKMARDKTKLFKFLQKFLKIRLGL